METGTSVVLLDEEFRILHLNATVAGVPPHALVGMHVADLVGSQWWDNVREPLERAREGETVRFAAFSPVRGAEVDAEAFGVPGPAGARHVLVVAFDRADLERQRELDRMKDEFISTVSHELRTPLTSVAGYLELIAEGSAGTLSAAQHELIEVARRNAARLAVLVEDLAMVSRVEAGNLAAQRQIVAVEDLLANLADAITPLFSGRSLSWVLEVDEDCGVEVDKVAFERVLINLISNAVKFTPDGGEVSLRVARDGDEVILAVSDTGIGVSAEDAAHLFERFFRAEGARRRAIQGTGLGLAIVRGIVEQHQGTITVTTAEGQGSTFEICLPAPGATGDLGLPSQRGSATDSLSAQGV